MVRGSAGIGKSALCRRVAAEARERGWLTVTVAATAGSSPYAPLAEAVGQLLGRDRSLLDAIGDRARATLIALAAPAHRPESGLTRHMVIGAVRRLVHACRGAATGVLLVLDDAHLADDATVEACTFLARATGGLPVVSVLAHRPDVVGAALTHGVDALDRAGRVRQDRSRPARPRRGGRAGRGRRTRGTAAGGAGPDRRAGAGQPLLRPGAGPRRRRRRWTGSAGVGLGRGDGTVPRSRRWPPPRCCAASRSPATTSTRPISGP